MLKRFPQYKSMGICSYALGQLTPQSLVESGRTLNSSKILWLSSFPAKLKIRSKNEGARVLVTTRLYEPRHEKTGIFAYAKTKTQISFLVTAILNRAFVFATRIVQFLLYLNRKFQASSHLLCLYSPVCVRPGQKP